MEKNIWHVIPCNDLKEHEDTKLCKCNPKIDKTENGEIVVHNSYDGREFIEKEIGKIIKST